MPIIRDLAMGDDGDLDLSDGKAASWVADAESIRQRVTIKLRMFRGEWYLDETLGVDYAGRVLGVGSTARAEAEIKRAILEVPGIVKLESFDLDLAGDVAAVVWSALTDTGELVGGAGAIGA